MTIGETVSVIIPYSPAHTPEEMLKEAIESAETQSVDTNIIVITDEDQQGPAWARNQGLERADTRYVAFLDADDLWKEKKLERQLAAMQETGAAICVEGTDRSTDEFIRALLGSGLSSLTPSILLDTDQADIRFAELLERREDHLFMIEAALEGGVCLCPDLVKIRKHSDGLSSRDTLELDKRNTETFEKLLQERIESADQYMDLYYAEHYHQQGRREYFRHNHRAATIYFTKSLRQKVRIKTAGTLVLNTINWITQPIRRLT